MFATWVTTVLEPVVAEEPDNGAAAGLLAWAYWNAGYWEKGIILANKMKRCEARAAYKDFDLLFQCYGHFFLDYSRTMRQCKDSLDRYPQAKREYALALLALANGNRDGAIQHFEARKAVGHVNSSIFWTNAFLSRLKCDADWPRANKKLHPDDL